MTENKTMTNISRVPLFGLNVGMGSSLGIPARASLQGVFDLGNETCVFRVLGTAEAPAMVYPCKEDDYTKNMMPLLMHLAETDTKMQLTGEMIGTDLWVYDMDLVEKRSNWTRFPEGFLERMMCVLQPTWEPPENEEKRRTPVNLRRREEYETFFNVCEGALPPWVADAMYKELADSKGSSSSSDRHKHNLQAMHYMINIDWENPTWHMPTLKEARQELDRNFYGLEDVKMRILEVIAQIRRSGSLPQWGILLNGPAGCGKTSIAKVCAKVLALPMITVDVSTLGDDPECLSGSSRIYSNARPGKILDKMLQNGTTAGVLLINEIDKASNASKDNQRSSADILLSLLDHQGFEDHLLEVALPTDNLFCVATCNDVSSISAPLRDRFLVIDIPSYSTEEKQIIWEEYVLPQVLRRQNVPLEGLRMTEEAVQMLLTEYATLPGARDLQQYAERLAGRYCYEADGRSDYCWEVTGKDMRSMFGAGNRAVRHFAMNPGEINAAFYYNGAAHFFLLEAAVVPGKGELQILGAIGQTQKDYIRAAYDCVRNTTTCDMSKKDVTIFVPQPLPDGAGNYVGCAAYMAICSRLLDATLAIRDIAFIGGVDLNGNLYLDEPDVTPFVKAMQVAGITTLYAPYGASDRIDPWFRETTPVVVIESRDAQNLITLAVSRNSNC